MIKLTKHEVELCRRAYGNLNRYSTKRFAIYREKQQLYIVAACRHGEVKPVVQAYIGAKKAKCRDIACHYIAGYMIHWSSLGKYSWAYNYAGGSYTVDVDPSSQLFYGIPINLEETSLEKRGFTSRWISGGCSTLFEYLSLQAKYPQVEYVAKAGLYKLMTAANLERLKDAAFMRYVRANSSFIRSARLQTSQIIYGFRHSALPISQAVRQQANEKEARRNARIEARRIAAEANAREERRRKLLENKRNEKRVAKVASKFCSLIDMSTPIYAVYLPRSVEELVAEGEYMHNCMGTYAGRINGANVVIVYLRGADGKPNVDIELDLVQKRVIQVRTRFNQNADEAAHSFAEKLLQAAVKIA